MHHALLQALVKLRAFWLARAVAVIGGRNCIAFVSGPRVTVIRYVFAVQVSPEARGLKTTTNPLLSRIATLVPPQRTHALRYHGVFAPNSKHRRRVVPVADGNGNHPPETACAGPLELIAFISEPDVARRILDHLGLASQAPPLARAQAPDDQGDADEAPDYQAGDPTYDE